MGILCLLGAMIWGLVSSAAWADRVLIVLSSEAEPYHQAQESCTHKLETMGIARTLTYLDQVEKSGLDGVVQSDTVAIIALGTPAAVYLHKQVDTDLPLFYAMVSRPAFLGLDKGHPCSGVSTDVPMADQFLLIHNAMSGSHRIGLLYRSDDPKSQDYLKQLKQAAPDDCGLVTVAMDKYDSMADAINDLLKKRPTIIWTEPNGSIYNPATIRALLLAGLRQQTPVFGFSSAFVKAGAMIGVNIEASVQGEQVVDLMQKLLNHPHDHDRPSVIVSPRYQVVINLIVAEKLHQTINQSVLDTADLVYRD